MESSLCLSTDNLIEHRCFFPALQFWHWGPRAHGITRHFTLLVHDGLCTYIFDPCVFVLYFVRLFACFPFTLSRLFNSYVCFSTFLHFFHSMCVRARVFCSRCMPTVKEDNYLLVLLFSFFFFVNLLHSVRLWRLLYTVYTWAWDIYFQHITVGYRIAVTYLYRYSILLQYGSHILAHTRTRTIYYPSLNICRISCRWEKYSQERFNLLTFLTKVWWNLCFCR